MNEEMRVEAMELCVTACEKHGSSNEASVIMPYTIISLVPGHLLLCFLDCIYDPLTLILPPFLAWFKGHMQSQESGTGDGPRMSLILSHHTVHILYLWGSPM